MAQCPAKRGPTDPNLNIDLVVRKNGQIDKLFLLKNRFRIQTVTPIIPELEAMRHKSIPATRQRPMARLWLFPRKWSFE